MTKYVIATLFGFLVTGFGLFAGLQISPVIGNILAFPFVLAARLKGEGFGNLPIGVMVLLFVLTASFWAMAFLLVSRLTKGGTRQSS